MHSLSEPAISRSAGSWIIYAEVGVDALYNRTVVSISALLNTVSFRPLSTFVNISRGELPGLFILSPFRKMVLGLFRRAILMAV